MLMEILGRVAYVALGFVTCFYMVVSGYIL